MYINNHDDTIILYVLQSVDECWLVASSIWIYKTKAETWFLVWVFGFINQNLNGIK